MPHDVSWQKNRVTVTFSGEVTDEDLAWINQKVFHDPAFGVVGQALIDAREATSSRISVQELEMFAAKTAAAIDGPQMRVAFLATRHDMMWLMSRFAQGVDSMASVWAERFFTDLASAEHWLATGG